MGKTTFGKGLVQGVFGLSDGKGLVMTVAKYETPRGASIQVGG
jgi:carboxyl-terminal processing protease